MPQTSASEGFLTFASHSPMIPLGPDRIYCTPRTLPVLGETLRRNREMVDVVRPSASEQRNLRSLPRKHKLLELFAPMTLEGCGS